MKPVLQYIDPNAFYRIKEAASLVGVSQPTLRKDARQGLVKHVNSVKGYMKFQGKELIHYRDYIV